MTTTSNNISQTQQVQEQFPNSQPPPIASKSFCTRIYTGIRDGVVWVWDVSVLSLKTVGGAILRFPQRIVDAVRSFFAFALQLWRNFCDRVSFKLGARAYTPEIARLEGENRTLGTQLRQTTIERDQLAQNNLLLRQPQQPPAPPAPPEPAPRVQPLPPPEPPRVEMQQPVPAPEPARVEAQQQPQQPPEVVPQAAPGQEEGELVVAPAQIPVPNAAAPQRGWFSWLWGY